MYIEHGRMNEPAHAEDATQLILSEAILEAMHGGGVMEGPMEVGEGGRKKSPLHQWKPSAGAMQRGIRESLLTAQCTPRAPYFTAAQVMPS
jgi:hypothetical protein